MKSGAVGYDTKGLATRLAEVANNGADTVHPVKLLGLLSAASADLLRLDGLINNPHTDEFLEAVKLEAAHQRERWGTDHDAGKTDADWFWLVGHLAGKALHSGTQVEVAQFNASYQGQESRRHHTEKRLHHIITTAAALLNWHAARTGADTRMRPGIAPPGGM